MSQCKNTITALLWLVVLALGFSCVSKSSVSSSGEYDTLYAPKYAKHFVVLSKGDSVVLRVISPWQGAKDVIFDYNVADYMNAEGQRIITMSTSHSALFDALGLEDNIVGVSGPQWLSNPVHRSLPDVGYGTSLHYETIVGLGCDIFTTYEVSGENSSSAEKLKSLKVPAVYIADYIEDSPLAKAEWIVALGTLVQKTAEAEAIFESVEENYNATKTLIAKYLEDESKVSPKVMLNSPYKDVWYMPGDSSYMVQLLNDAGACYVAKGTEDNVSRPVSMESAFMMLREADVWLNPAADIRSCEALEKVNPLLKGFDIEVYTNSAKEIGSGSDFWESGVLRCDVVLKDLAKIFYRDLPLEHNLYYHWKLPR